MEDITHEVLDELGTTCPDCGEITIDEQSFSCFRESPTHITYRARIEGTSETSRGHFVSLIEKWVRSGRARIIVTQIQLTVDPHCSVAIPSLTTDWVCEPVDREPAITMTIDLTEKSPTANTGLIGGFCGSYYCLNPHNHCCCCGYCDPKAETEEKIKLSLKT